MKKGVSLTIAAFAAAAAAFAQNTADFAYTASNGAATIAGYRGSAKRVTIPAQINNLPVAAIGAEAFYGKQLSGVTIGATVTVSDTTFPGNLTDVYINGGKQAGTYRSSDCGGTWREQ